LRSINLIVIVFEFPPFILAKKMGGVNWILPVASRGIAPTIFKSI